MTNLISDEKVGKILSQVDENILILNAPKMIWAIGEDPNKEEQIDILRNDISSATKYGYKDFIDKFKKIARNDICRDGGVLHAYFV
jgi:hypothetical protein